MYNALVHVTTQRAKIVGILSEVGQIGQAIQPHLQSSDPKTLQTAGTAIVNAAHSAINAYAS